MPISFTIGRTGFVDAAKAEGLTAARVKEILDAVSEESLKALTGFAQDSGVVSLKEWISGYPSLLGSLTESEASFLIRIAVDAAGGKSFSV